MLSSPKPESLLSVIIKPRLKWTKYIPHKPTPKQLAFLLLDCEEAFYGGAAGGGKSDALLMGALQYVDSPQYAAIIFRKSFADLTKPEALMDRARSWLSGSSAEWKDIEKAWHFPNGATLSFGYLDNDTDIYHYQSAAYQYIGFDELTQFKETQYRYLFSRLRRLVDIDIPLRVRAASNPGNIGHDWVKQRFIVEGITKGRVFIPATLDDNPHLDRESYVKSLDQLDPTTRQQLLKGDWSARQAGSKFRREWFEIVDSAPVECRYVRYWDLASTAPTKGSDPDWTVGALMGRTNQGTCFLKDIRRLRGTPQTVESLIKQTAQVDDKGIMIYMEQEPGSSGVNTIDHYRRLVLPQYSFYGVKTTGNKEVRANPVSSQAEAGNIKLVRGMWINAFLDEIEAFPDGAHDDQVDAVSGAYGQLATKGTAEIKWL